MKNIREVTKEIFDNENSVEIGKHIKSSEKDNTYFLYDRSDEYIENITEHKEDVEYILLKNELLEKCQEEMLLNSLGIPTISKMNSSIKEDRFKELHKKRGN